MQKLCPYTLEAIAQELERSSFLDLRGVMSRRKRDREDAALRRDARIEMRREIVELLRAKANREDLTPCGILRQIADTPTEHGVMLLSRAWPLAWSGLIEIHATTKCTSNCIPPECEYKIVITDKGWAMLNKERE